MPNLIGAAVRFGGWSRPKHLALLDPHAFASDARRVLQTYDLLPPTGPSTGEGKK